MENKQDDTIQGAITRKELAQQYKVHINTLRRWLKTVPGLKLQPWQLITPAQQRIIRDHLG